MFPVHRGSAVKIRLLAPLALGLSLAGIALAACSGLDPNPPHPGVQPDPGVQGDRLSDPPDGSPDVDRPDASGDAP